MQYGIAAHPIASQSTAEAMVSYASTHVSRAQNALYSTAPGIGLNGPSLAEGARQALAEMDKAASWLRAALEAETAKPRLVDPA